MKVALVGAELEENLGLCYIASALEHRGHKEREKNKGFQVRGEKKIEVTGMLSRTRVSVFSGRYKIILKDRR